MKLLRKWRAKGHGIHSPFAYSLITNVIHSPHRYYAFSDLEEMFPESVLQNKSTMAFHRLSFRLAHHFKVTRVLEIGATDGVNATFIEATGKETCCTSVINKDDTFDAIFIYTNNDDELPNVETLLSLSHDDTFWVVRSIINRQGKQFWRNIIADERVRATFDVTETGIIFLQPMLHKLNYRV